MKPTSFCRDRHRQMIEDRKLAVTYAPFVDVPGNTNGYGEIVDRDICYPNLHALAALVEQATSKSMRDKFGEETRGKFGGESSFDIVVIMAGIELSEAGVTPKAGDRLEIETLIGNFYVVKVAPTMQAEGEYREYHLACARKVARDG